MKLTLKDFQVEVVRELTEELRRAAGEVGQSHKLQAVGLSSPTGSGKTVMATAALEVLLQGDDDNRPIPDAVFLWITDQPQLNEQTRRKMLRDSSLFSETNLVTIGTSFDQATFDPGTVNFLNIQKLGRERDLISAGDGRQFTIWDTVAKSVEELPERFFVIIDEAHRGMSESSQARSEAATIIQKFIKGFPGEIPPVPLIMGISATIDRFNSLVSGAHRTLRPIDVPVEAVRASGLLKDVVTLFHPTTSQPTDITMLREAVRKWRRQREEWRSYCSHQNEEVVRPALVVQVQDGSGSRVSRTDLDEVVAAIEQETGGLGARALAHSFQEGTPVSMNGKEVRYLAPPDVDADREAEVVLFKTSLNTGWDCPRAEVMMSFRTALDSTSIAQLVGRMVRNPLARRIEASDVLNTVFLYLPHYDQSGLAKVITRLTTPDPATLPPVEFRQGENLVVLRRNPLHLECFAELESLPSYLIPTQRKTSQVRRLMRLARALENDEIESDAEEATMKEILGQLRADFSRIQANPEFQKAIDDRSQVVIQATDWQVGLSFGESNRTLTLRLSPENIDDVFEEAGRRIGDEGMHKAWWRSRRADGVENSRAKVELVQLAADPQTRKRLETYAQRRVQELLRIHARRIEGLSDRRQLTYSEIRALVQDPELVSHRLPEEIAVNVGDRKIKNHLFVDSQGEYPPDLNGWEWKVLESELQADPAVSWFRNLPRKPWSLTVPYEMDGRVAGFYPDFVFFHEREHRIVPDLLDPHHINLTDAPPKAVGLAKYAARHHPRFGRIELIIVRGTDEIKRLDLTDEQVRQRVLAVRTKEHLSLLFEQSA